MSSKGKVVIAGGSGTLGSACAHKISHLGYEVVILSRSIEKGGTFKWVHWDPKQERLEDTKVLEGALAVLNFTGTPLDGKRWTSSYKQKLYDSRVVPAQFLAKLISKAAVPPKMYLGSSAIGIYGDAGAEPVTESYPERGSNFVTELGQSWEAAHYPGSDLTRSVMFRIAVVFDRGTGFIGRLAMPAMFGFYPFFGNGNQYLSWVHIDDLVKAVVWAIENPQAEGIYNLSAPDARPLKDIMRLFRKVNGGWGFLFGLPRWLADIFLGEMAGLLFSGANVVPDKLQREGFVFSFTSAEEGLRSVISPRKPR